MNLPLREFLRTRRAHIRPEDVGFPRGPRRRTPGLRREELAVLAGVSSDYYTRLEQGRSRLNPSDSVLTAVARALGLNDAERAHLFDLVRRHSAVPGRREEAESHVVRPALSRLLQSLDSQPAFVLGRRMDVLAINRMGRALIDDFPALPAPERNKAKWVVLSQTAQRLYRDWDLVAADVVGTLRNDAGRHPDDPRTAELVRELSARSEMFRRRWSEHHVVDRNFGHKRLHHGLVGDLTIEYEAMKLQADPDQSLYIYHAADRRSREALERLNDGRLQ